MDEVLPIFEYELIKFGLFIRPLLPILILIALIFAIVYWLYIYHG